MAIILLFIIFGFFTGSLPFSYWSGKLFLKTDIRRYGDGNPGGYNAWIAGGWRVGLPVVLLDIAKGFIPVMLARFYGIDGWNLVLPALAPAFGHAYSPWLKFRGGKALATTLGIWLALLGIEAAIVIAFSALFTLAIIAEHAWVGIGAMVGIILYVIVRQQPWELAATACINLLLIAAKHWLELRQPVRLRNWLQHLMLRR